MLQYNKIKSSEENNAAQSLLIPKSAMKQYYVYSLIIRVLFAEKKIKIFLEDDIECARRR